MLWTTSASWGVLAPAPASQPFLLGLLTQRHVLVPVDDLPAPHLARAACPERLGAAGFQLP